MNIIVWVRGGLTGRGEGGKIMMIDFGKRKGESIILFAEKEFKPKGRGRGRGGRIIIIFFCKARGGSIIFWARMKPLKGSRWVGGDREGRESSQGRVGGRGRGEGGEIIIICFFFGGGGRVIIIISAS